MSETTLSAVVVGLGYVGLPLAREMTAAGVRCAGVDSNPAVVAALNHGQSHVDDVPDDDVLAMLSAGFCATTAARPSSWWTPS